MITPPLVTKTAHRTMPATIFTRLELMMPPFAAGCAWLYARLVVGATARRMKLCNPHMRIHRRQQETSKTTFHRISARRTSYRRYRFKGGYRAKYRGTIPSSRLGALHDQ